MAVKRNTSIDFLRCLAAVAVVVYHVLGSSANNDPQALPQMQQVISAISDTLLWHVPVFFMMTGYLWLREGKACTLQKMLPNIRRFVLVLVTIGFAYAVMERFFVTRRISGSLIIGGISDVLTGRLWDHMWYVYAIIGIYLILPILKIVFANGSERDLGYLVALLFVFSILVPLTEQTTGYKFPVGLEVSAPLFYVCAGGWLSGRKQNINAGIPLGIFLISCTAAFITSRFFAGYEAWQNLLKSISAVSLFTAFHAMGSWNMELPFIRTFSDCTFGIYLFHPLLINIMIKLLHIYPLRYNPLISLPTVCVGIVGLSFAVTHALRRSPWVRKYIL